MDREDLPRSSRYRSTHGVLPNKWHLKIKRIEDGTVDNYKARLVILVNLQHERLDYDYTNASVADFTLASLMRAIAA